MIKHIFFDLDDTLFDFQRSEKEAVTRALRHFNVTPTEHIVSRYNQINLSQWKLLEIGKLTVDEVKVRRYEILFGELGLNLDAKTVTACYEAELSKMNYLLPNTVEALKSLSKHYNIYGASNGAYNIQKSRLENSEIKPYLKKVFISEKIGVNKPNKAYFDYCFSAIPNFKKDEAVIVGDSLTSDIKGGINAGIKTIWFNGKNVPLNGDILPDFEISNLIDLDEVLNKINKTFQID